MWREAEGPGLSHLRKDCFEGTWHLPLMAYVGVIEELEPGCSQWCRVIVNRHMLKWGLQKKNFSTRMVKQWLPREAMQTLFLEVFKIHLIWPDSQFYSEQNVSWGPFQPKLFRDHRILQLSQDFSQGYLYMPGSRKLIAYYRRVQFIMCASLEGRDQIAFPLLMCYCPILQ